MQDLVYCFSQFCTWMRPVQLCGEIFEGINMTICLLNTNTTPQRKVFACVKCACMQYLAPTTIRQTVSSISITIFSITLYLTLTSLIRSSITNLFGHITYFIVSLKLCANQLAIKNNNYSKINSLSQNNKELRIQL